MKSFGTILRELRGNKTQADVAEKIGLKAPTYATYENDMREANFQTLNMIADYYGVTIDYLLGRTECKSTDVDTQAICQKTGLNEEAISNLEELKNDHPELVDTAINLISDFDNLIWVTSAIHEMAFYSSILYALEEWHNSIEKNEENGEFFVSEHINIIKNIQHSRYDCLEAFRKVADELSENIAKDSVVDLNVIKNRFEEWRGDNAQR